MTTVRCIRRYGWRISCAVHTHKLRLRGRDLRKGGSPVVEKCHRDRAGRMDAFPAVAATVSGTPHRQPGRRAPVVLRQLM